MATFTATSAVCVTGLTVVDTATYWSALGQVIILVLQAGGSALAGACSPWPFAPLGLRQRLSPAEINVASSARPAVLWAWRLQRLELLACSRRLWLLRERCRPCLSLAFNNAGSPLRQPVGFVDDGWVSLTVTLAVIAGGSASG